MNTTLRRSDRALSEEAAMQVAENAEYGVLSIMGNDGYPYAVPLNFVRCGEYFYAHSAKEGKKLDSISIAQANKVCINFVETAAAIPEKFSFEYKSATLFCTVSTVSDRAEKVCALKKLIEKYSPDFIEKGYEYVARSSDKAAVLRFKIDGISGKERKR